MSYIKLINSRLFESFFIKNKLNNLFRHIYYLNNNKILNSKYNSLTKRSNIRNISNISDICLFNSNSEKIFQNINDKLIDLCDKGIINDIDCHDEFMNITFNINNEIHTIVISKQIATKQIWYSSSLRKPDYFDNDNNWLSNRSNKTLYQVLREDIYNGIGIDINFEDSDNK